MISTPNEGIVRRTDCLIRAVFNRIHRYQNLLFSHTFPSRGKRVTSTKKQVNQSLENNQQSLILFSNRFLIPYRNRNRNNSTDLASDRRRLIPHTVVRPPLELEKASSQYYHLLIRKPATNYINTMINYSVNYLNAGIT